MIQKKVSMDNELRNVTQFFASNNIALPEDWLTGCLEWLREENEGRPLPTDDLHSKVYEQWLLLDFKEVSVSVLPRNIVNEKHIELRKTVCLQLMSVVDISKPKYFQIQKIRNTNMAHCSEDDNFGKRVLQLTLTDGVQEILATEYKPIECLNLNLTPGLKVKINAPVTIRRGQIFLKPGNISLLGGEVESILITHASENVLARALGLPINETPVVIENQLDDVADVNNINMNNQNQNQSNNRRNKPVIELTDEEEMLLADEMDMLMEVEAPKPNPQTLISSSFKDIKPNVPTPNDNTQKKELSTFDEEFDEDEYELLMQQDPEEPEAPQQNPPEAPPQASPKPKPGMTLKKLNNLKGKVTKGLFKVHARFKGVVQKLKMTEEAFSIKIIIADDEDECTVAIHSDVIANIVGYEPEAILALKNRKSYDSTVVSTLLYAVNSFKQKLECLDCLMEILLEANQDEPMITKLL